MLTTAIGASAPSFGLRYFGSIGRLFSISCSEPAKRWQLVGLGPVLDGDEGLERRLVVEPVVFVDLVGPDGRLDASRRAPSSSRRCRSNRSTRTRRRGIRGTPSASAARRRAAARRCCAAIGQLALVLRAVRDGMKPAVGTAPNRREEAGRLRLLRSAKRIDPLLHFRLGRAFGIEVGRGQFRTRRE